MVREAGRGQQGLARATAGPWRITASWERSGGSSRGPGQRDTLSGFKGTELMQVPCFGLGGRSDSSQCRVIFPGQPKVLESRLTGNPVMPFTDCLSMQGHPVQSRYRTGLSFPALDHLQSQLHQRKQSFGDTTETPYSQGGATHWIYGLDIPRKDWS